MINKLIVVFVAAVLFGSCSAEENETQENSFCELEVWGLSKNVSNTSSYYEVEHGPTEDDTVIVVVNQATYDYYVEIFNDDDPADCWEGMK